MIFLGGARQTGKTTKMIEWLRADKHRTLVTFNLRRCEQLRGEFPDVKSRIIPFYPDRLHVKDNLPDGTKEVGFDDLDIILSNMYNVHCTQASFTGSIMHTYLN